MYSSRCCKLFVLNVWDVGDALFWTHTPPAAHAVSSHSHLVFDQEKAKAAPPSVDVRQAVLPPVCIHVDEPVAEGHRRQIQDPRPRSHEGTPATSGPLALIHAPGGIFALVSCAGVSTMWLMETVSIVPRVRAWNWSEFRRFLIHHKLHLVEKDLVPPHRWLQRQRILFSPIRRNQPRSLGPVRPFPRVLIAPMWIFSRFHRWARHRHMFWRFYPRWRLITPGRCQ